MRNEVYKDILSLASIVKDEGLYIKEWIEFHRMVGVTHFYIYDHESTDNLYEKLSEYIKQGIVTYTYWDDLILPAYNHCLSNYKNDSKYIGFIDIDEFIIPVKGENLGNIIDDIFNEYEYCGGLGVNWRMYGSSHHENRIDGLVMENYKLRAEDNYGVNKYIKTICNPRVTKEFKSNPHLATYIEPYHCINENGVYINSSLCESLTCNKIRINHYHFKSKQEYILRKSRPSADNKCPIRSVEEIEKHFIKYDPSLSKVYDSIVDKYINELRKRCGLV